MSGWAGFWMMWGLIAIGVGVEAGLKSIAAAMRERK